MRRSRSDDNQAQIVKYLRKCGYSVAVTSLVGDGFPDLVVGGIRNGERFNWLVEVKNPAHPPSQRVLTPDQVKWHESWRGQKLVIETAVEFLEVVG